MAIPQPLTSTEIKDGITTLMCAELPETVRVSLREPIRLSLDKTCSLNGVAYTKFMARWTLDYQTVEETVLATWWINYDLDDFGRITSGGIGGVTSAPRSDVVHFEGTIQEMPPDKFRRETEQPVPAPTAVKKPDPQQGGMSKSLRGMGKRREV